MADLHDLGFLELSRCSAGPDREQGAGKAVELARNLLAQVAGQLNAFARLQFQSQHFKRWEL